MSIPQVKIDVELQAIRYQVVEYIEHHNEAIEAEINRAVEEALTPQALESSVRMAVNREVRKAVEKRVRHLFTYDGEAKQAIDAAVDNMMRKDEEEKAREINSFADLQDQIENERALFPVKDVAALARPHESGREVLEQAIERAGAEIESVKNTSLEGERYYQIVYRN